MVVPGVDDENITLADINSFFDHFAGVDIVITANIAQIDDRGIMDKKIQFQ